MCVNDWTRLTILGPNPDCMYLHDTGATVDSFTKEDMAQGKHLLSNKPAMPATPSTPAATAIPPVAGATVSKPVPMGAATAAATKKMVRIS